MVRTQESRRRHHRSKVNSVYYCQHVLGNSLLSTVRIVEDVSGYTWILQYRTVHRHTLPRTARRIPELPHIVASNSSDIKPVDCAVWVDNQQTVYGRRRLTSVEEFQHVIITEWGKLSQWLIDCMRHKSAASPAAVRRPTTRKAHFSMTETEKIDVGCTRVTDDTHTHTDGQTTLR